MLFGRKDPGRGCSLSRPVIFKKREDRLRVGGQAVIEGVMMRSPNSMAVAVRRPNGEIVVKRERLDFFSEKKLFSKLPLVRGVITLLSALVLGMKALNFSANQSLEEEQEVSSWTMGLTFTLALCFGIFLFFLIPLFLTKWLRFTIPMVSTSGILFNLVDGIIRLIIFLAYLWAISFFKEVRRIFQYHGAEHKSIFAFESGEVLAADRVRAFSYLHPRCGTSFLLIVMVVSILVFALIPHQLAFGYKVASRVVFIPLIAGLAYEIIRFADQKRERKSMQYFIKPGLWLQRLTAREPSEDQIEVALRALQEVLQLEEQRRIGN
ncbi:MAG TPA: DUF1385 domain-containing protein [Thermodesulfobacteriota bacterium]|nr:DUF1385 domain-containing protein [Thermodesulfobacteriota bacterium]